MPKQRTVKSRVEQKAVTREGLLRVARKVFTKYGYAETSVADICRAARVTHGALYHHFAGKIDIFSAVVSEIFTTLAAAIQSAADAETGWAQVEAAARAYLNACMDPTVQVILLREAPTVLAQTEFKEADATVNEPLVAGLMRRWIEMGIMRPLPLPDAARILGGAFAEAGAAIATAKDSAKARAEAEAVIHLLLAGLKAE